ncbi:MAG: HAMP domain-containing histidine kinase [Alphaproteobacteria bacterium]|nr:HAMP domain-containing histidine kinase [Alphaproteobacteria bacterium]
MAAGIGVFAKLVAIVGAAWWVVFAVTLGVLTLGIVLSYLAAGKQKNGKAELEWDVSDWDEGLSTAEMSDRSLWFIQTRWYAAGFCFLVSLWTILPPIHLLQKYITIDFRCFFTVGVLLAFSNVIYSIMSRRITNNNTLNDMVFRFISLQVLTDFMSLSFLTYGLGSVETPILIIFLPHIILLTMFFSRSYSLVMTVIGIAFATLPMILEYLRIVPIVSIFDATQKIVGIDSSLVTTSGHILGISATFLIYWYLVSNITSILRRRERQLEQAINRMKFLDREKCQLTLRATHELKAPLAAINSYVYTLRDGYCGPIPEKASHAIERIGERCDLLMEKITNIIHLSNLRTLAPADSTLVETDLMAEMSREVEDARLIGKPRGITVVFQPRAAVYPILASKNELSTMISNLLCNAVNYSRDNGRIEVDLEMRADTVSFYIQDHGIGIPEEHLTKIFEEHFRSNNAVRFNPNSSGMGLALVKEIVRLHNAEIYVSSQLGEGSRFIVTFARSPEQPNTGGEHGKNSDY